MATARGLATMPNTPLSRYKAIRTSQVDEFEHRLRAVYGATRFNLTNPKGLYARGDFAQLQDIALCFGACRTPATIDYGETDFARLQLPLRGHGVARSGTQTATVGVGGASLTSPGHLTTLEYGPESEHIFVRIAPDALRRNLAMLLDAPLHRLPEFELVGFTSPEMLSGLRQMIQLLVQQLNDPHSRLSPIAVKEMEQAAILQLLFASRHSFSALLEKEPSDPASSHLRQAEAYIEANWNRPIGIEALAEAAGVSARSLFKGFAKTHGCSPMNFVKRVRLRHARDLLTKPDNSTTVVGIALACGFSNPGHFAKDYRAAFGQLPSEDLHRSKRR
jgi:AraC-like DNA-binding protein